MSAPTTEKVVEERKEMSDDESDDESDDDCPCEPKPYKQVWNKLPIEGTAQLTITEIHDPTVSPMWRNFTCKLKIKNSESLSAYLDTLQTHMVVASKLYNKPIVNNIEVTAEFTILSMCYKCLTVNPVEITQSPNKRYALGEASLYVLNVTDITFLIITYAELTDNSIELKLSRIVLASEADTKDLILL